MFTSFMPLSLLFLIYFGFILYLLRDCEFTSNCWQNLGIGNFSSEFFSLDIHSRLEENCKLDKRTGYLQIPWSTLFAFGVWILWQHRNRVIFKNFTPNQNIYKEIVQKAAKFAYCAQNMAASKLQVEKYLQWERPHRGWFKLKY